MKGGKKMLQTVKILKAILYWGTIIFPILDTIIKALEKK